MQEIPTPSSIEPTVPTPSFKAKTNNPNEPAAGHADTHLPRKLYRKEQKQAKRRLKRQRLAQERTRCNQEKRQKRIAEAKQRETIYQLQKAKWEEKERECQAIEAARKVAKEVDKRAREQAMVKTK
ncbi:hypothetical protein DM01DRAFT_1335983 [Hesseltinella vesiculosa]|uniref:Uncharacterized protein n=1 Tax=Hesseltinella vesiculosa TaxID=101127 RepID=A0A1X2GI13_9FUNG|nr:hypothetical protein DM01DRAFT_1335983 [Hesseltinella vesiculosa]